MPKYLLFHNMTFQDVLYTKPRTEEGDGRIITALDNGPVRIGVDMPFIKDLAKALGGIENSDVNVLIFPKGADLTEIVKNYEKQHKEKQNG